MNATHNMNSLVKIFARVSVLAGLVFALTAVNTRAAVAVAVDTKRCIEASQKGNKSEATLIKDARAAVAKKRGTANKWVSTSRRGYGAVAQNGHDYGAAMACGSQVEADRLALQLARGGRIIDRWLDR